jgi:3-(3-hydroxy-phenyl)propionate hydroxylase
MPSTSPKAVARAAREAEQLLDRYTAERRPVARDEILGQAHARTRMQQRDPAYRRAEMARLQAIAKDPEQAREYLLRTSMISGLRSSLA